MKLFIFGAGASRDAQHGNVYDNVIPPLTNELFDIRYAEYANRVGLSNPEMNTLRNKIAEFAYLEEWLTGEWEKIKNLKEIRSINAQKGFLAQVLFYVWVLLVSVSKWNYENQFQNRETNAYQELMSKLRHKDEPFGIINFNYDLLLDYAYKDQFRLAFNNIDDYLENNYVKPHGSINWLLSKRKDDLSIDLGKEHNLDTRSRLDTAINLMFKDLPISITGLQVKEPDHRDIYTIDDLLRSFGGQYFYPLIFLPLTSKAYSSIEGFEEKIISKGKDLMKTADEIYLIGYRANDELIREMLKLAKPNTKLHVIGKGSAAEIRDKVLKLNRNIVEGETSDEGFYHFAYNAKI